MDRIPEPDWKLLRKLEKEKLAIACENALDTFRRIIDAADTDSHTRYLNLFKATRKEDRKIADMFNDLKRSAGILNLSKWYQYGILSEEELQLFTVETRDRILLIQQLYDSDRRTARPKNRK